MPRFNTDLLFDVGGRNIGEPTRRPDAFLGDVDISGTLTGIGGLGGIITNLISNMPSMDVQSDTGTGGLLRRMRIKNDAGSARVAMELQYLDMFVGSEQALLGGMAPFTFLAGPADTAPFIAFKRRGVDASGAAASYITAFGEYISYANGYTPFSLRTFLAAADMQPSFGISAAGQLQWGTGGASPLSIGLGYVSAALLALTNLAGGYSSLDLLSANFKAPMGTVPFTVLSTTLVPNLNADLLGGGRWANPGVIGISVPNLGYFSGLLTTGQYTNQVADGTTPMLVTSKTPVANLTVKRLFDGKWDGIVDPHGDGVKHKRVTTGAITAGARAVVRINWPEAFSTSNYSIAVAVFDSLTPATAGLTIERFTAQELGFIEVQVKNEGAETRTGTLHAHAMREF